MVISYRLKPVLPIRTLVIALIGLIAGGVTFVNDRRQGWGAWTVFGLVLVVLALVLGAVAVASLRFMTVRIDVTQDGYRVLGAGRVKSGEWSDVTRVDATPEGSRLVIAHGSSRRTYISAPRGGEDPQMQALTREIRRHLHAR